MEGELSSREKSILHVLHNKELSGLQIHKAIKSRDFLSRILGVGLLYPVLHSLEKKGLVESRWGEKEYAERGGAKRRYYKLTKGGNTIIQEHIVTETARLEWNS